jgi:hypothetical protein
MNAWIKSHFMLCWLGFNAFYVVMMVRYAYRKKGNWKEES